MFEIVSVCCSSPLRCVAPSKWIEEIASKGQHKVKLSTPFLDEQLSQHDVWWGGGNPGHMAMYRTENVRRALADCPEILVVKSVAELVRRIILIVFYLYEDERTLGIERCCYR